MRVPLRSAMSFLALLTTASTVLARGDGTFVFPLKIEAQNPIAMAAGDFNRDGKVDLAASNGLGEIAILLQDPADRTRWRRGSPLNPGVTAYFIRSADLDADGDPDLVVAEQGTGLLTVRCRGDGTFDWHVVTPGVSPRWATLGDWDGDQKLDAATANHGSLSVSVLRGDGTGRFSSMGTHRVAGQPHAIEALDYDGDGKLDLAVGLDPGGLLVMKGRGDGGFDPRPGGDSYRCSRYLAAVDFNDDGRDDLVTSCNVLMSGGTFQPTLYADLEPSAAADLDGDGQLDLASRSGVRDDLRVLLRPGRGDGRFLAPMAFGPAGQDLYSWLLAEDLDGDGRMDVVTGDDLLNGITFFWGTAGARVLEGGQFLEGLRTATAVAVGDLDRDGSPDLVIPSGRSTKVHLTLDRLPAPSSSLNLLTSRSYSRVEPVDVDGDGLLDLVGTDYQGGLALVCLLEEGTKVRKETALPAGVRPIDLAIGLLDQGSTPDLAVACQGSNQVAVFLGVGAGDFAEARNVATVPIPNELAVGDLDRDGFQDLAVTSRKEIAVHRGNGSGEFAAPVVLGQHPARYFTDVAIADLNGDGLLDVVVGEVRTLGVHLYRGKGGLEFEDPEVIRVDASPSSLALADLDGTGLLDITVSGGESLAVLLNPGGSGGAVPVVHELGQNVLDHRLADFDGDGALDLAALLGDGSSVAIFHGRPAPPPPGTFLRGDADSNRRLEVTDTIRILDRLLFGGDPLSCEDAADANDDGKLNITDPILLLGRLFLGGEPLAPPGPEACGEDPSPDSLEACSNVCR